MYRLVNGVILLLFLIQICSAADSIVLECQSAENFLKSHSSFFAEYNNECDPKSTCLYSGVNLTKNSEVIFKENENFGRNCIVFYNSTIYELPKNLLSINPNSSGSHAGIFAANSSIHHISPLENYKYSLQFLILKHNKIQKLEVPVVNVCDNIDFSFNKIHTIEKSAFDHLKSGHFNTLCKLNVSHNKLEYFSVEWFDNLHNNKLVLDFSHNLIDKIVGNNSEGKDSASSSKDLELNLSWNKFRFFPIEILTNIFGIKKLNLSGNFIEDLSDLRNLTDKFTLYNLDLSSNNLKEFSCDSFGKIVVYKLDLSNNKISTVSATEARFFSDINLSHNLIMTLPVDLFHFIHLETVDTFDAITDGAKKVPDWLGIPKTRVTFNSLDLSSNLIKDFSIYEDIPDGKVDYVKPRTINLSHNKFKSLSMKALSKIVATEVNLSNNKIHNFKELSPVQGISNLNLAENHIQNIPYGTFAESSIVDLNLRGNKVKLKYGIFPSTVKNLDLRNNAIGNRIHENHFAFYKDLKELRLEGNEIEYNFFRKDKVMFRAATASDKKSIGLSRNKFSCDTLVDILSHLEKNSIDYNVGDKIFNQANVDGIDCVDDYGGDFENNEES